MSYTIEYKKTAKNFLNSLSGKILKSVTNAVNELADNPRPQGAELVKPYSNIYRIRQGSIRIIYEVQDDELIIIVIDIGNRGQIYNNW